MLYNNYIYVIQIIIIKLGLIILGICENVSESHWNIKVILDMIGVQYAELGNWMNAFDCKLGNYFFTYIFK